MFPPNDSNRKFQCFVCGLLYTTKEEFCKHIIEKHEEGREYILCPCKHCGAPVRDLRIHFKNNHKGLKLPACQYRATVIYDVRDASKGIRKKVPGFKSGMYYSPKNNKEMKYRSGWELEVYKCLETMGEVLRFSAEPFHIFYYYRGKRHRYFPDIKVDFADGRTEIWEIKPASQSAMEMNNCKWDSAKIFCLSRGWKFEVITEQTIQKMKRRE